VDGHPGQEDPAEQGQGQESPGMPFIHHHAAPHAPGAPSNTLTAYVLSFNDVHLEGTAVEAEIEPTVGPW